MAAGDLLDLGGNARVGERGTGDVVRADAPMDEAGGKGVIFNTMTVSDGISMGTIGMRYKNSDIGERIWRDVIASPSWLPPPSTPGHELVVRRRGQYVINHLGGSKAI